jgi:hypothetical protein
MGIGPTRQPMLAVWVANGGFENPDCRSVIPGFKYDLYQLVLLVTRSDYGFFLLLTGVMPEIALMTKFSTDLRPFEPRGSTGLRPVAKPECHLPIGYR